MVTGMLWNAPGRDRAERAMSARSEKMHSLQAECLNGRKIGILEMTLKSVDNQLELSWKITAANAVYRMVFFNVSRLRLEEISAPIEIHGFEIIDHSQNGWE